MAVAIHSFFKLLQKRALIFTVAVFACAAISTAHSPLHAQVQSTKAGTGLYEKQCETQTLTRIKEITKDKKTGALDTIYESFDSLVCRLVEITHLYPDLTLCDTLTTLLGIDIDTIHIAPHSIVDESAPNSYYTIYEIYDTTFHYQLEVNCRRIDTLYLYDTLIQTYKKVIYDTANSADTLRVAGPAFHTDTTFTFCAHITNPYNPYAGLAKTLVDSIQSLERQLAELLPQWQARYGGNHRDAIDYEAIAQAKVDQEYELYPLRFTPLPLLPYDTLPVILRDSCLRVRRQAIVDSLTAIAPLTPAALQARLDAFRALLQDYAAATVHTEEYHLDSVHVIATVHENGGTRTQDFVVRTIPMFYRRQADTTIRNEEPLMLLAGSPYLPPLKDTTPGFTPITRFNEGALQATPGGPETPAAPALQDTTYTTIEWGMPLDAATHQPVAPARGFHPGSLRYVCHTTLEAHNPEATVPATQDAGQAGTFQATALATQVGANPHLQAWQRDYARQDLTHDSLFKFPAYGPLYLADTLDGDSLLFPLTIRATPANRNRYPGAPDFLCEHHDTIKVVIKKGYEVKGYVSYAGLWFPSQVGDTRTPDVATTDGDLKSYQLNHLPIANATVYLKDPVTGAILDTALSGPDGYFRMTKMWMDGKYVVTGRSPQKTYVAGLVGLNGNDAAWVQNYTNRKLDNASLPENTNPDLSMWWWASNVDLSTFPELTKGLSGNDMAFIQNKITKKLDGGTNKYKDENTKEYLDDWAYSIDTLNLVSDTNFHVRGVMRGDADRNYDGTETTVGGAPSQMRKSARKKIPKLDIAQVGSLSVPNDIRMLNFPLISEDSGYLRGFQIFLYYNPDKIEALGASLPEDLDDPGTNLAHNVIDDQILTTWVSKQNRWFYPGDTMLILNLKLLKRPVKKLSTFFQNNPLQYVVSDTNAQILPSWRVSMPALDIYYPEDDGYDSLVGPKWLVEEGDTVYDINDNETSLTVQGHEVHDPSHILAVVPNPMIDWGDVTYYVSQSSLVNLKLYSMIGENVITFVEGERQFGHYRVSMNMQSLPSGIYILRLETTVNARTEFDIAKIVIKR